MKEFADIPNSIDLQLQLKPLGHVYAALTPFIIVQPLSAAAVIDVGSTVVDSESRNIVGLVRIYSCVTNVPFRFGTFSVP